MINLEFYFMAMALLRRRCIIRCAIRMQHTQTAATSDSNKRFFYPATVQIPSSDKKAMIPITILRRRKWRQEEKQHLLDVVKQVYCQHDIIVWEEVAALIPDHSPTSCKLMYRHLTKTSKKTLLQNPKNEMRSIMSLRSAARQWTQQQDQQLLTLQLLYGSRWNVIGPLLNKSPTQCSNRMTRLRKQRIAEEAYATANNPTPAPAPPRIAAGYEILKAEKVWTPAETQILRDLLETHGGFYYPKFAKHLPGFSYNQVHQELERLQVGKFCKTGRWTASERKELLYLARNYSEDWFMVARKMSTPRTATQCRAAHRVIVLGHTQEPARWSQEETERLHHLVKLFREGKLDFKQKDTTSRNDVEYNLPSTDASPSPRLRRMMQALEHDTAHSESTPADTPVKKPSGIPWSKIATLMGFRTPVQCMSKWSNERRIQIHEQEVFGGPWSLEEDRMLYTLFLQAPRKWSWLAQNLPRRRRLQNISWRHRCCIMHYVDMLKGCRGPSWDPLADGFEEVHHRCEINAWYSGISEGYRTEDGYTCPYDLDLTGYRKWVAESSPQPPHTDERSAPIKGLLPTVEH